MQNICFFAHYDQDDRVDEYVLRYLQKIKDLKFDIVFVSTSRLGQTDVHGLHAHCLDVIVRENIGLDFASWSAGIAKHQDAITGRMLLANDSVYGPFGDLTSVVERLTSQPADFYGMVESIEIAPHLQSWFLLFEPWVARNPVLQEIMAQPFSSMTKPQIITNGEVAISRRLSDASFKYKGLYMPTRSGLIASRFAANPMHLLWRELLFDLGVPFLKVDLLRDNPKYAGDATTVLAEVEPLNPTLSALIRSHLARIQRKKLAHRPTRRSRWAVRAQYAMLRQGYLLRQQNKRTAEVWTFLKLAAFTATLRAWSFRRRLIRRREM